MNLHCRVIEDLLPLYHDGVCSEESRSLVEEHLKTCESCAAILAAMDEPEQNIPVDDVKPLESIEREWNKSKSRALKKGLATALLICTLLGFGISALRDWKCIEVDPDLLEVSELSQLSDGRIIYHMEVLDNKNLYFVKFTTLPNGDYYLTPMRSIIEGRRTTDRGLFKDYFMVDIAENNAYQQNHGDGIVIKRCFLGPVGEEAILLWEEGMELPAASAALEDMVR